MVSCLPSLMTYVIDNSQVDIQNGASKDTMAANPSYSNPRLREDGKTTIPPSSPAFLAVVPSTISNPCLLPFYLPTCFLGCDVSFLRSVPGGQCKLGLAAYKRARRECVIQRPTIKTTARSNQPFWGVGKGIIPSSVICDSSSSATAPLQFCSLIVHTRCI